MKVPNKVSTVAEEEIQAVTEVLRTGMLTQGPVVKRLEDEWARLCGTRHAVATSSGTTALSLALKSIDIKKGEEVITSPFTFIATVNCIINSGATPVFVDIEPDSFCMDPRKIRNAITGRTVAIMPVHLFGMSCNMDPIMQIAKEHGLFVIEDACQAVGATWKGKPVGSIGDVGVFSLHGSKNLVSGEGGMLTTNFSDLDSYFRQWRNHGMTQQYQYEDLGWNYRMTDVHAAIGLAQVRKFKTMQEKRNDRAHRLQSLLRSIPGIQVPEALQDRTHVWSQFTIRVNPNRREDIFLKLKDFGIDARIVYPYSCASEEHVMRHNHGCIPDIYPVTDEVCDSVISLPMYPDLSDDQIQYMHDCLKKILSE